MNLQKIFLFVVVFTASFQIFFAQEQTNFVEEENWLRDFGLYPATPTLLFRYDRYSKEDIGRLREKLVSFKSAKFSDEWEGIYYQGVGGDTGMPSLRLETKAGFADIYIYTCFPELRYINYGKIANTSEFIELIPEFAMNSPRKESPVKYIKIKWNNRYYLVEESSLSQFAEKIVGIYVEPESSDANYQKWTNYWVMGDTQKELIGFPEFPQSYKRFQRFPIETKIIAVGKRTIENEVETARWTSGSEVAVIQVTIGVGLEKGVKKGMVFEIPETNDAILIKQVYRKHATGIVGRQIDENKNDECYEDKYLSNKRPCAKIKPNFKTKTVVGEF